MDSLNLEFKIFPRIESYDDIKDIMEVRFKVFCEEQKFGPLYIIDKFDFISTHIAMILDGKTIGTSRVFEKNNRANFGRFSILPEHRGKKLSIPLFEKSFETAKEKGFKELDLLSQSGLVPYYEKVGFVKSGPEIIVEDSPHVPMTITFSDQKDEH